MSLSESQKLQNTLEAGEVLRYHSAPSVPSQTVGQHSFGVAVLCLYLANGVASRQLLAAAIMHDTAELFTGDIPYPVKKAHKDVKELFDNLEHDTFRTKLLMEMPVLTEEEQAILKLADTLDGYLWCRQKERGTVVLNRWNTALENAFVRFHSALSPKTLAKAKDLVYNT